ncbi:MAG: hypothetical protein LBS80_00715 [Tannerella sp.]|jgi:hypothetical protein|nr:hypothetical protein [Tannerella sp.]
MKNNLRMALLITGLILIGATGTLFALTIPASPADHDTFLTTLIFGKSGTSQTLVLDASGYQRLIIPQRLIAGQADSNSIDPQALFAVIAGGRDNTIGENADNYVIGAGWTNTVDAKNATIGAGQGNTIYSGAENSFIGGGISNQISSSNTEIGGGSDNEISAENSVIP